MRGGFPFVRPLGEFSILISFEPRIGEDVLEEVLFYRQQIQNFLIKQKVEVTSAYSSLLVIYISPIKNIYDEVEHLKTIVSETKVIKKRKSYVFKLPTCYSTNFGLDLELISSRNNLSVEDIIRLHMAPVYTVYFIGFLPGFLYLGGLDEQLKIPRKNQPRLRVEKGAVGIGENQTGIYPQISPGGWQIIGNCPVPLFDKDQIPPCEIQAGDRVKFYPVSEREHMEIQEMVREGKFSYEKEEYNG